MDIGYVIDHHGDEYSYKSVVADEYGYAGDTKKKNIVGYFDISSLKDAINPGSASFYTRAEVAIGGIIDYFGASYRVETKIGDHQYDVLEVKE